MKWIVNHQEEWETFLGVNSTVNLFTTTQLEANQGGQRVYVINLLSLGSCKQDCFLWLQKKADLWELSCGQGLCLLDSSRMCFSPNAFVTTLGKSQVKSVYPFSVLEALLSFCSLWQRCVREINWPLVLTSCSSRTPCKREHLRKIRWNADKRSNLGSLSLQK